MRDLEAMAIKHMYQSKPRMFFQLAFRLLHPGVQYLHNWSIDMLGEALARCHRRETTRLIINMPPRSLKSVCASVAFPAWLLGVQPESKIVCVAGHRGLVEEQHELTRDLMTHPKYRSLFPHVCVSEVTGKLKLAQGGFRTAFTPSGAMIGRGADVIIIDDPQSAQGADDPQSSELIRNWYDRSIYQRLDDKHDGVVIVVMQRLAHDDLTAHLLKQDCWEVLKLPAIAMEVERMPESLGGHVVRRAGEALHPGRESRDQLREAMLRMGAKAFMSQYQQEPYPAGLGQERCGAFHIAPHPDATEDECKGATLFFAQIPEEDFVLDRVFGEETCIRQGGPPPMTVDEWIEQDQSMPSPADDDLVPEASTRPIPPKSQDPAPLDDSRCGDRFGVRCEPCSEEDIRNAKRKSSGSWC